METSLTTELVKGLENEVRFFKIVAEAIEKKLVPSWLVEIVPATIKQDLKGVDAIATVRRRADEASILVPVQIKSSKFWVGKYFVSYPKYWQLRVVCVVVNEDQKDKDVLRELLDGLEHVYSHQYDYQEFFAKIEQAQINQGFLEEMEARQEYQNAQMRN
jgi:hypothetical protein